MNVGEILILFTFRDPTSHVVTVSEVFKRYSIAGVKLQVYISLHIPCIIINPYKLSWAGGCRCRCKVSVLSRYRRNHKLFEHFKNKATAAPPVHRSRHHAVLYFIQSECSREKMLFFYIFPQKIALPSWELVVNCLLVLFIKIFLLQWFKPPHN